MCNAIKFSKFIRIINGINFTTEKIDKRARMLKVVSELCHEKIEDKFRVKVVNDLLKRQRLRSSAFVMYIDIYYDAQKDLILIDYPFYPKKYP
jgi:hypothetical protein